MIKALFCDFYGTVVYEDDDPINSIVDRIYRAGGAESREEISTFWWRRFSALCAEAFGDDFRTQRELELQSLAETLKRFNAKEDMIELSAPQFAYWKKPPIFSDSKDFFCRCPLPIHIVSNIDTADLDAAMRYHNLYPAGIVTSEEARSYKPRPNIFLLALHKFCYSPDEVIHLGDSVTSDVLGAKAARIQPVWINRKKKEIPTDVDRHVMDLVDVIDILATGIVNPR